ncbi:peptidylprolyl isomerase [uncultured Arsenicicoccus sp.]|uniref:peptidylprolyl isomerase n=1 Tax=uncultured Arsenicicoccus sp. TaxID=491339 RepID=UPI002599D792|nr:peptidylprolyl isomerase [uncultured Arsenicicoccus sp.]
MTREQERARARRRHDKVQAAQRRRAERRARTRRLVAVVATVAIVLATVVGVALAMRPRGDSAAAPSGAASPTGTAGPSGRCTTPPALQSKPKQFGEVPDKATAEGATWVATLRTTCGPVTIELDGKAAPQTVASFLHLAREGYWAPSPCHRLTTGSLSVLQCGDPTGTGASSPGYGFGIENAPADGAYPRGVVAMARTQDPNSNGGQFFVVHQASRLPTDGGGYSIFGKVTGGMDIVDQIAAAGSDDSNGRGDGRPKTPISILEVSVTKKKA